MRLVFLGSGAFGLRTLQRLHAVHQLAAVVTQPDRPAGRKRHPTPTPIGAWAISAGVPVIRAEDVNAAPVVEQIGALGAEAAVVIAFGQKLSPALIGRLGRLAINLHASLLPKFRGAAPINWAIIQGEVQTGLSVIALAQTMDAGAIYARRATPIDPRETAGELHDRLAEMGPDLVCGVLRDLEGGTLQPQPQEATQASRAPKLSRADGWVDFNEDALVVARRIMGLTPWPGVMVAWQRQGGAAGGRSTPLILRRAVAEPASLGLPGSGGPVLPGQVLDGYRVAARQGSVKLLEVQLPGGLPMSPEEFVRGHPLRPGDRLCRAGV
jgi:methionyl-tRNA formyltransferase